MQKLEELEVDKYAKKLTTIQLIQLIAYAQFQQQGCLRENINNFHCPDFQMNIGLQSISFSQIFRQLRDLAPELFFKWIKQHFNVKHFLRRQPTGGRKSTVHRAMFLLFIDANQIGNRFYENIAGTEPDTQSQPL